MRFLAALAAIAVTSVKAIPDVAEAPSQRPDHNIPQPEVDVVEVNKEYIVRLDCVGCPYAAPEAFNKASWQQPPHALVCKTLNAYHFHLLSLAETQVQHRYQIP